MAHPSACLRRRGAQAAGLLILSVMGCVVEGDSLAVSAGAPVSAAVQGRVTDCGDPVGGAEVLLTVQQNRPEQARPFNMEIGPVTTDRSGNYLVEVSPAFAVPGPADVRLQVNAFGFSHHFAAVVLELRLGHPARDTLRFDADLGVQRRSC